VDQKKQEAEPESETAPARIRRGSHWKDGVGKKQGQGWK
jgi:hypothetical protein